MTASRIADIKCKVLYNISELQDDGSSEDISKPLYTYASIVPLRPKEIQRLLEGGITVRNGVSIVLTNVQDLRPDKIVTDKNSWRVLTWTFMQGTAVAECDEITIEGV
jgi:hypothetical protein